MAEGVGALYLYKINNLYKGKGISSPLILLTYFYVYPELFYSLFSIILSSILSRSEIRFASRVLDSYFY